MSMKLPPTASSSSSYEDSSSSSEEEETDYESEPELVADSKIVETSSTPKTTATSLSEVEPDSSVVKPPADSSSKVEAPVTIASSSSSEEEETDSESETEQEAETDPLPVKPPADSTSKVEDPVTMASSSSEEEETDSESETEQEVETAVKPPADPSSKAAAPSEEETDSESETEAVADSKIVETSSEPNTRTNSLSEVEPDSPAVKPPVDSSDVKTSEKPVTKKRSFETDEGQSDEGEAKRVKMISGDDDDKKSAGQETKKNCFQRVWAEEDEITILQGIIDYKNETLSNPFDDKTALYERLKMFLTFDASKTQFVEKIRSLKKKYVSSLGKERKRGEEPTFSKPHELEVFRLSKFVWGDEGIMGNAIEAEPPVLKLVGPAVKKKESVSVLKSLARFGVDDLVAKNGWSKLSLEDKKTLEEECEALQLEELTLYSRKSRFIHDAVTKMAEASQRDL